MDFLDNFTNHTDYRIKSKHIPEFNSILITDNINIFEEHDL